MFKNNEIIVFNRGNMDVVYYYNSVGEIINIFDSFNLGLNVGYYEFYIWIIIEDDWLVVVLKNGVSFFDIFEWDYGLFIWYNYVNKEDFEFESEC